MQNKLPQGWSECELGNIIDVRDGTHDSPKYYTEGFPLVTSKNLKDGVIDMSKISFIKEEDYKKINERSNVNIGDVLFAMIGTIGNPVIVKEIPNFAIKNVALFKQSKYILSKFLKYYLDSSYVINLMLAQAKGSTQKFVGLGYLRAFNIKLPPLNEQKRIVAKIEELFENIDTGIEKLELTKEQIKRYRQSVLKSAFDGKLTKQLESDEPAIDLLKRINPKIVIKQNPNIPQGWVECELKDFTDITMGQSPPSECYNEEKIGLPFFQGKAEFGVVYPTVKKWCSAPNKIAEKDDILLSVRAPVGATNICPEKSCIGRGLSAIRGLSGINNIFIINLLKAFEYKMHKESTGTTFSAITGEKLKKLKLPLPPLNEQKRIVEEIEKRFEVANEVEKVVNENIEKAKQMKQSILKKAFDGRLVPQDPTDEPASILLEKIKSERSK